MNRLTVSLILILLSVLTGCFDPVVDRKIVGEPVVEKRLGSCTHSGFCHTCGIDYHGDFTCGFRFTSQCQGERNEVVKVTEWKEKLESGKTRIRKEVNILEAGSCR